MLGNRRKRTYRTEKGGIKGESQDGCENHYEGTDIYFLTARGKPFARQLYADGRVQIAGYTRYKETIRISGRAVEVPENEQIKWRNILYQEQPYLENVYPADHKGVFCGRRCDSETERIQDYICLHCGNCYENCPVQAIERL